MTSHDPVTPQVLPHVVSHSKSDGVIKIIIIIMTSIVHPSMVKMKIMTMMIMMDDGLCRAGLNFPARDRLKWGSRWPNAPSRCNTEIIIFVGVTI